MLKLRDGKKWKQMNKQYGKPNATAQQPTLISILQRRMNNFLCVFHHIYLYITVGLVQFGRKPSRLSEQTFAYRSFLWKRTITHVALLDNSKRAPDMEKAGGGKGRGGGI